MIGGLLKSASRLALVAAAGVLVGGVSAQAADLGGDCCADLEERVAELEATTARKGNRKVSLEISGHVSSQISFWDDGKESNAYVGSGTVTATRLRFLGSAKINPTWSAGYLLEFGIYQGANSFTMQQGPAAADDTPTTGYPGPVSFFQLRHSAWWIDNKDYGRLWVGQTGQATDGIAVINLANTTVAGAHAKTSLNDAAMLLRTKNGAFQPGAVRPVGLSNVTWGNLRNSGHGDPGDGDRVQVVKYVSPTVMGFIFSAAWGEDDMWDVALRYAGEMGGFKIAAGIGYQQLTDGNNDGGNGMMGCGNSRIATGALPYANGRPMGRSSDVNCEGVAGSASVMHVPTGLFVTGAAGFQRDNRNEVARMQQQAGGHQLAGPDTLALGAKGSDSFWYIQAGIEQNWTGIGKTTLYGEFHQVNAGSCVSGGVLCMVNSGDVINPFGVEQGGAAAIALAPVNNAYIQSSRVNTWGFGVVQAIDAAAMDLFFSYRMREADVTLRHVGNAGGFSAAGAPVAGAPVVPGTGALAKANPLADLQIITIRGMIKF